MKIKLYDHPFAAVAPKEFEVNSVAEWLFEYYGETPKVSIQVYKGEPSKETDVSSNATELLYGKEELYTVLESPGDPATLTAMSFAEFATQVAIAMVISVVMSVLFPPPTMPNNVNRNQRSPNNSLTSRENQVRLGERVEDIYGTVKSIPSLMMPTYYKYVDHKQTEYGYYCVGRGYYDINELKDGDTPLSDISKSGARIFGPFTSPNSGLPQEEIGRAITEQIVTVSRPEQVNGITLSAANQVQFYENVSYDFVKENGVNVLQQNNPTPSFGSVLTSGDFISVVTDTFLSVNYTGVMTFLNVSTNLVLIKDEDFTGVFGNLVIGDSITTSGFVNSVNNGTFTVVAVGTNTLHINSTVQIDEYSTTGHLEGGEVFDYSGMYEIEYVNDTYISLAESNWTRDISNKLATVKVLNSATDTAPRTNYTDWVTLDEKDRTQVWVNVVARGGMFHVGDGGKETHGVGFNLEVEKLDPETFDPTGIVEITYGEIVDRTSDERAVTVEHTTSWAGPCRVRMQRLSNFYYDFKGTIVDEIKWNDLYSVTPVSKLHFGNKTTIQTVSQATVRATNIKQRQLNCIASRRLPIYNGVSFSGAFDSKGEIASGTISATSKLVDILAAVCNDPFIGNNATQLDISQVWGVQQELDSWDTESGQFNYTFDSDTTSFEETISIIANAGFCLAYRQNGKIRLSFDKLQANSSALFTHRNKKPNSETITRVFATDSEFDGVEFVYSDPDTNQSETIKLPLDESALKYKKFEIPGIRSFTQAWYRANREYQKLKGQRLSIETTCTTDARLLLPNTRIDVVDNTRFKAYDGEVIKQSGLTLTLSKNVEFTTGTHSTHSILLMKRDGSLDSIICTAGATPNQVILANTPEETVVTTSGIDGIRTIFSFASDSARLSQAWLVQEVGISDGQYVDIKAINYSDSYYYYDTQPVPDSDLIINGDYEEPVETFYILTESGGVMLTEDGNAMIQE